jgi:hypothetical protein
MARLAQILDTAWNRIRDEGYSRSNHATPQRILAMASRLSNLFSRLPPIGGRKATPVFGQHRIDKPIVDFEEESTSSSSEEQSPRLDSAREASPKRFLVARPTIRERPQNHLQLEVRGQKPGAVPVHVGPMAQVSKPLHEQANKLERRINKAGLLDEAKPHWKALKDVGDALTMLRRDQRQCLNAVNGSPSLSARIRNAEELLKSLDRAKQKIDACLAKTPALYGADRRFLREVLDSIHSQKIHIEQVIWALGTSTSLPQNHINAYSASAVPINWRTKDAVNLDAVIVPGSSAPVGEGQVHKVERLRIRVPDPITGAPGGEVTKVFKGEPLAHESSPEALNLTLDTHFGTPSFLSGRAVAASNVSNNALHAHVIPRTELAIREVGGRAQFGVAMDYVDGVPPLTKGEISLPVLNDAKAHWAQNHPDKLNALAQRWGFSSARWNADASSITFVHEYEDNKYDDLGVLIGSQQVPGSIQYFDSNLERDPVALRELSDLDWVNYLTNQVDGHAGNYAIERNADGGVVAVHSFDNDLSGGVHGLDHIRANSMTNPTYLTELPPVISGAMYMHLMALSPEALRAELTGLVSPSEVDAYCARLGVLKLHAEQLKEGGLVLDMPSDWTSEEAFVALKLNQLAAIDKVTVTDATDATKATNEMLAVLSKVDRANIVARDLAHMKIAKRCNELGITNWQGTPPAAVFDPVAIGQELDKLVNAVD